MILRWNGAPMEWADDGLYFVCRKGNDESSEYEKLEPERILSDQKCMSLTDASHVPEFEVFMAKVRDCVDGFPDREYTYDEAVIRNLEAMFAP